MWRGVAPAGLWPGLAVPRRAAIGAGSECMPTERDPNFLCLARPRRRRPADALLLVRPGQGRAQRSATWECESTSISVPLTTTGRPLVRRSSLSLSHLHTKVHSGFIRSLTNANALESAVIKGMHR